MKSCLEETRSVFINFLIVFHHYQLANVTKMNKLFPFDLLPLWIIYLQWYHCLYNIIWLNMRSFTCLKFLVILLTFRWKIEKQSFEDFVKKFISVAGVWWGEFNFWNFVSLSKFVSGSIFSSRRTLFVEKGLELFIFISYEWLNWNISDFVIILLLI